MRRFSDLTKAGSPRILRTALAVSVTLVALSLRGVLAGDLGRGTPYLTFFPAVVIGALLGGWETGALATLISALMAFVWIQQGTLSYSEAVRLAIFLTTCSGIVLLAESLRRAKTQREEADRALTERDRRSRKILDAIRQGYALHEIILDPQGRPIDSRFLEVNDACADLFGRSSAALVGTTLRELDEGLAANWLEPLARVAQLGEVLQVDQFSVRLGRWYHLHGFQPAPGLAAVLVADITASKEVDLERFQAIFAHSTLGIACHDLQGQIQEANPAFLAMLGYAEAEFRGMPLLHFIHPEDAPGNLAMREDLLAGRIDQVRKDTRWIRKDGGVIWVALVVIPVHDAAGRINFTFALAEDITQRKLTEQALRDSEARLRGVLDNTGSTLYRIDARTGQFEYISQNAGALTGRAPGELLAMGAKGALDLIHPADRPGVEAALARLESAGVAEVEYRLGSVDGGYRWVANGMSLSRGEDGQVQYRNGNIHDISKRKAMEEALTRVLRERELILETANVGISLIVDRRQVWLNRWMADTFQYSMEEMLGSSTRMLYPSQEAYERHGQEAYPVLARGGTYETDQELLRRDGQSLWARYYGRAVNPGDLSQGVLWIIADVTREHQEQALLKASEAQFRTMFESHGAVMLLVDPESGRIVDANPAAVDFYGYGRDRLRAMDISEINQLADFQWLHELQQAAGSRKKTFVFPHRLANGQIRTVEVHSSPTQVGGGSLLFSIIQDVSERMVAEANLIEESHLLEARVQRSLADLREKDQMLINQNRLASMGEMLGNIAHQWRQPLNALSIHLANARDDCRDGTLDRPALERSFAEADRLIQGMSTTINDFKNFFRPDKAKVPFHALAEVQRVVALVAPSYKASGIRIEFEASEEAQLFGYPNEYSQVLLNLLGNAREAIQSQELQPGRIAIRLWTQEGFGGLAVSDNGGGIQPQVLDRIFEPYFSTRASGTGIGLYMSKQIIERSMGGRISARNHQDGAEFTVLVPTLGG